MTSKDRSFCFKNRCLWHPTIALNNFFLNGSSKKTYFYIKKAYSKKCLEKERILGGLESFFISQISFYGEFKKFFCTPNKFGVIWIGLTRIGYKGFTFLNFWISFFSFPGGGFLFSPSPICICYVSVIIICYFYNIQFIIINN